MSDLPLETITDTLAEGYKRLLKGTFQEASEVQIERRTDDDLRNTEAYTAHLLLARLVEDNVEFGLTGRPGFDAIVGQDSDTFNRVIQWDKDYWYSLAEPQIRLLPDLKDVVWVKAVDLRLQRTSDKWGCFFIDTSDVHAEKLNEAQRLFAVKAHGSLKTKHYPKQELPDYGETMLMLKEEGGISHTELRLPAPEYLVRYLVRYLKKGKVIAGASILKGLYYDSIFTAGTNKILDYLALRGVVPDVSEAERQKIMEVANLLRRPRAQEVFAEILNENTFPGYKRAGTLYRGKSQGK